MATISVPAEEVPDAVLPRSRMRHTPWCSFQSVNGCSHQIEWICYACNSNSSQECFFFSMSYLSPFPSVIIRTSILLNMVYIISLFFRKTWIFSQQTPPPISGRLTLTTLMICCWMDSFLPLSAPSSTSWKTLVFPGLWMWVVTGMITGIAPVELLWTAIECFVTFPKKKDFEHFVNYTQ